MYTDEHYPDSRLIAPSADRNKVPILKRLKEVLPGSGLVLEIASGTGQHAIYFAEQLPGLQWQPSDPDPRMRASITAWIESARLQNALSPLDLDACAARWPIERADAVLCINMIHISRWSATLGLLNGAARLLAAGSMLFLYGPFRRFGQHTAASNEAFDRDLRRRNPEWGVRDVEAIAEAAQGRFNLDKIIPMPANNFSLVFRKL